MKLKLSIVGIILLVLGGLSYVAGMILPVMYKNHFTLAAYILVLAGVVVFIIRCINKLFCCNKKHKEQN